jgi:hypothetical protein
VLEGPFAHAHGSTGADPPFAAGACLAEALEARMAMGEAIDIAEHCALTGVMSRVAARIGINRLAKDA